MRQKGGEEDSKAFWPEQLEVCSCHFLKQGRGQGSRSGVDKNSEIQF